MTLAEWHKSIIAEAEAEAERIGQEVWGEICEWFAVCRKFEVEDAGGDYGDSGGE